MNTNLSWDNHLNSFHFNKQIGKDNLPSIILLIVEKGEAQFKAINDLGGKYEPWQLVAATAATTYLGFKFYYYYIDLENGKE